MLTREFLSRLKGTAAAGADPAHGPGTGPAPSPPTNQLATVHGVTTARWRQGLDTWLGGALGRRAQTNDSGSSPEASGSGAWSNSTRAWSDSLVSAAPWRRRMGPSLEEGRLAYLALLAELPAGCVDEDAAPCRVELQLATRWSELFSQRPALFQLLARQFSQAAAERRLQALDARFPPPAAASRPGSQKRWPASSGPFAAVASITRGPLP